MSTNTIRQTSPASRSSILNEIINRTNANKSYFELFDTDVEGNYKKIYFNSTSSQPTTPTSSRVNELQELELGAKYTTYAIKMFPDSYHKGTTSIQKQVLNNFKKNIQAFEKKNRPETIGHDTIYRLYSNLYAASITQNCNLGTCGLRGLVLLAKYLKNQRDGLVQPRIMAIKFFPRENPESNHLFFLYGNSIQFDISEIPSFIPFVDNFKKLCADGKGVTLTTQQILKIANTSGVHVLNPYWDEKPVEPSAKKYLSMQLSIYTKYNLAFTLLFDSSCTKFTRHEEWLTKTFKLLEGIEEKRNVSF